MSSHIEASSSTAHEYILWILPFAFALHVVEERALGFVPWAQRLLQPLGMGMEWPDFFMANAAILVWGICAAAVGWKQPGFSLSFPVMMVWNPLFHVAASLVRLELSPGVFTGVFLYVPLSLWTLCGARKDGVLTRRSVLLAVGVNLALLIGGLVGNLAVHRSG